MKTFQRFILILAIGSGSLNSYAQHFAWTSTIVHTGMEYTIERICTPRHELCVGGTGSELNYSIGTPGMFDKDGNEQIPVYDLAGSGSFIYAYDFDGRLKWYYPFNNNSVVMKQFTYDKQNRLVALIYRNDDGYDDEDAYYDEEDNNEKADKKEQISAEGYYLWYFDSTGTVDQRIRIPELLPVEISDFSVLPSGDFAFAGHADEGKLATNLKLETGPGGCDYILFMHADGHIYGGDALSYQKESCCTYGSDPKIAVDEKGNVFLGGAYVGGAKFGGKTIKLAPVPYGQSKYYDAFETYIAAYDASGKFLWVNTAGCQSRFNGIAAAKGYVYISTSAWHVGTLYGHALDTTDHQHAFITAFGVNGKFKRNISTGAGSQLFLSTDAQGNLVATGTIGIETGYLKRAEAEVGKYRKEDCFITFFSPGGEYKKHVLVDVLTIPSDDPPVCLAVSPELYFLSGNLFASLSLPLSAMDTGFPKINFSASAPFIGRCK